MIEFLVAGVVALGLGLGVFTEVLQPTAAYALDQGKAGYEYVQEKLD